jgi:hypothetical protein
MMNVKPLIQPDQPLAVGTPTAWGEVRAIIWNGSRVYVIANRCGETYFVPASKVEAGR